MLIPLHYVLNNHFEIMYPKNCQLSNVELPYNKENYNNNITKINSKRKIAEIPKLFVNQYVSSNKFIPNKYNEIFEFLKYGIIPKRINDIKNTKKRQKKRYLFKKHSKKYMIAENRLWYYFKYINKNHKKKNIKNNSILVESDLKDEIKNMENDIIPNINKKKIIKAN